MNDIFNRFLNGFSDNALFFTFSIISLTLLFYFIWDLKNFRKNQLSKQVNSRIGKILNEDKNSFDIYEVFDKFFKKKNEKTLIELEVAGVPFTLKEYNSLLLTASSIGFIIGSLLFPLGFLFTAIFSFIPDLALRELLARLTFGILLAFAGSYVPKLYIHSAVNKKRKLLDTQIQDALLNLADALRSGFVISDAIRVVGEDLPSPMGDEFFKAHKEMDAGKTLHEALNALKNRVNLSDLDMSINAIIIQDELGGKLESLLRSIVHVLIERQELKKEIEKTIANSRMVGLILMIAPIFFAIVFFMMNKEQTALLYNNLFGIIMTGSAVVAYIIAIVIIFKIINNASSDL